MSPSSVLCVLVVLNIFSPLITATNEAGGNSTASDETLTKIALERISAYTSSIRYWDTTNAETRQSILKELAIGDDLIKEQAAPGCPKIRYPIICDEFGTLSENVCYFRMRRRERQGILPIMVFTHTPIEEARQKCDKEFVKKP